MRGGPYQKGSRAVHVRFFSVISRQHKAVQKGFNMIFNKVQKRFIIVIKRFNVSSEYGSSSDSKAVHSNHCRII